MYKLMGLCGLSASRKRSWATIEAEVVSSTPPLRQMMRSFSRREKMSSGKRGISVRSRYAFTVQEPRIEGGSRTCVPATSLDSQLLS